MTTGTTGWTAVGGKVPATGADCDDLLISIEGVGGSNIADQIYGSDRADVEGWFYRDDFGNEATPNCLVGADDLLDGRGGLDGIACDQKAGRVTIDLQRDRAVDASGHVDTLLNLEMARGSQADDRITGAELGANCLFRSVGNDRISGLSGPDYWNGSYGRSAVVLPKLACPQPLYDRQNDRLLSTGRLTDASRSWPKVSWLSSRFFRH